MHGTVEASKLQKGKSAYDPWSHISHKELIYLLSDSGFRQNPRGSNTGVRTKISPPLAHALTAISKLRALSSQNKGHRVYTGSGHRCGVIPYSSVVWWIASWARDEQVQGKNNILRRGVLELGELVWLRMI